MKNSVRNARHGISNNACEDFIALTNHKAHWSRRDFMAGAISSGVASGFALAAQPVLNDLRQTLLDCQADEVAHRNEAAASRGPGQSAWVLRAWCAMVGTGSKAAVALIRHI